MPPEKDKRTIVDLYKNVKRDYELNNQRSLDTMQLRRRVHLEPVVGNMLARDLTKDHIAQYALDRKTAGAKPATINRELSVLRRCFSPDLVDDLK